jgi:hypothetical protein
LNTRLRNRKNAIANRREQELAVTNGTLKPRPLTAESHHSEEGRESGSPSGFVAVNSRTTETMLDANGNIPAPKPSTGSIISAATRADLLNLFSSSRDRQNDGYAVPDYSTANSNRKPKSRPSNEINDYASILLNSASPGPLGNTPSGHTKMTAAERFEDNGPYKAEMLARMETMARGERVLPPCDRCRRLHMDCLKNLTACLGCTRKHAKCSWKEVTEEELLEHAPAAAAKVGNYPEGNNSPTNDDGTPRPVLDEELLGEDDESDSGEVPSKIVTLEIGPTNGNGDNRRLASISPQPMDTSSTYPAKSLDVLSNREPKTMEQAYGQESPTTARPDSSNETNEHAANGIPQASGVNSNWADVMSVQHGEKFGAKVTSNGDSHWKAKPDNENPYAIPKVEGWTHVNR